MEGKARIIFPIVMAFMMSIIVSGIVTVVNLGIPPDILLRWFEAWLVAFPAASIAALIAVGPARKVTGWIVRRIDGAKA